MNEKKLGVVNDKVKATEEALQKAREDYQRLLEKKHTTGLSEDDITEMTRLDATLSEADQALYRSAIQLRGTSKKEGGSE